MKYRARCSKPAQHRKTIQGVYDPNDRVACHVPGCKGLMRKDVTRERDPIGDRGAKQLCHCDGYWFIHKHGSKGCNYHNEVITARNLAPRSKHSSIPAEEWVPF